MVYMVPLCTYAFTYVQEIEILIQHSMQIEYIV